MYEFIGRGLTTKQKIEMICQEYKQDKNLKIIDLKMKYECGYKTVKAGRDLAGVVTTYESRNQQRKDEVSVKARKIAKMIEEGGFTSIREYKKKFRCGTNTVYAAMELVGLKKTKNTGEICARERARPITDGPVVSLLDQTMYRPKGVNLLTVSWMA